MPNNTTIAIIGVAGKKEVSIAKLFAAKYHVLLFDHNEDKLSKACHQITLPGKSANAEMMHCPTDASWEADVILLLGYTDPDQFISKKIDRVATQKIVVVFVNETYNDSFKAIEFTWRQLLPYSKLITVSGVDFMAESELSKQLIMESNDEDALKEGAVLFASVGFNIQILFTPLIH